MTFYKLTLMLSFALLISCSNEKDEIREMISDDTLYSCIKNTMKKNNITDIKKVLTINCEYGVKSLTGLSNFKNLEKLYIQNNELEDLSSLGESPNLKVIYVAGSKTITSLYGIGQAHSIEEIQANKAPLLHDISDLSTLKNLKVFSALMASIEDISSFTSLNKLTKVVLNYNSISDISPLANKDSLIHLQAYKNPITVLGDIKSNKNIKLFGIDKNLDHLCKEIEIIRKSLSQDAKIYGPENCQA